MFVCASGDNIVNDGLVGRKRGKSCDATAKSENMILLTTLGH